MNEKFIFLSHVMFLMSLMWTDQARGTVLLEI